MKRFHFRLEHVLRIREGAEEAAKLELGRISRKCDELRIQIEAIGLEQRSTGWGKMDPSALFARQAYLTRLKQDRTKAEKKLATAEVERRAALAVYTKTRQEAEVLRNLREKQFEQYRIENLRQEDALLDDIVQSRLTLSGAFELSKPQSA